MSGFPACICVCHIEEKGLKEKGFGSPGTGVSDGCEPTRDKAGSSARASALTTEPPLLPQEPTLSS